MRWLSLLDFDGGSGRSPPLVTRAELPWLGVALFAAVALRAAWVIVVDIDPNDGRFDDTVFYHNAARVLADGKGYDNPYIGGPTAQWPPAYAAALAVVYKLFGWHVGLAYSLNVAFAAATVGLVYLTARRIFDWRVAYGAAVVLACFPGQIYFSALVLTETMFALVFTLVLLLALLWTVERADARWWQLLVLGSLVGFAALVRVEGAFLAVVLAALWVCTVRPWRRMPRYALLLSLGAALTLTPWTVRNAVEFGQFIPLRANLNSAIAHSLDPEADRPAIRREDIRISTGEGLDYQLRHPWELPEQMGRKLYNLYRNDSDAIRWIQHAPANASDWERPLSQQETARWERPADSYFFAVGMAAVVAAVLCLLRRHRASLTLIVAGLGWSLLFSFITPDPRFHFAIGPLLAILAAALVVFAWEALSTATGWSPAGARPAPAEVEPASDRARGAGLR